MENYTEVPKSNTKVLVPSSVSKNKRGRAWQFTWNNYTDDDIKYVKNIDAEYIMFGKETGDEENTPHLQGIVYFTNAKTFNATRKIFKNNHIEPVRSIRSLIEYNKKQDPEYFEKGKEPTQGERTDLKILVDQMIEGKRNIDEIITNEPNTYHTYGRTLEAVNNQILKNKKRNFKPNVIWIYGESGTGKTESVMEDYKSVYKWKYNDNNWQDKYNYEDVLLIDEFRGNIQYGELLDILDKYSYSLPKRGGGGKELLSKTIIIVSPLTPIEVYKNLSRNDDIKQLYRRIDYFIRCKRNYTPKQKIIVDIDDDNFSEFIRQMNE